MACKDCGATISPKGGRHDHEREHEEAIGKRECAGLASERAGPALPSFEENERLQAALVRQTAALAVRLGRLEGTHTAPLASR